MIPLNRNSVNWIYNKLCKRSLQLFNAKKYPEALDYIKDAARWMYSFNIIFKDEGLENTIKKIASVTLPLISISEGDIKKIVFIDNFGFDNRGLTQQYLRGFINKGYQILYILHNDNPNCHSEIIRELKEYDKSDIKIYKTDKKNYINTAKKIQEEIRIYNPANIFLHIAPWDIVSLMAISNIEGTTKFNINLTDHAFWLGCSFIDYNIEFRGYGEVLSLEKRDFSQNQIVRLPYYPIVSKFTKFEGFPDLPKDSIIIFCGGAEYKMLGHNGIFFHLMDSILDIQNNVVICVAGISEKSVFSERVKTMKNRTRIYLLGNRKDINEVFRHSDIYLSSYPLIGGLMTQFAALNAKPILAYREKGDTNLPEFLINHKKNEFHSKEGLLEFINYAKILITDKKEREIDGRRNHDSIISQSEFENILDKVVNENTSPMEWQLEQPNYDYKINLYLDIENQYTHEVRFILFYRLLKNQIFSNLPLIIFLSLDKHVIFKTIKMIWEKLNKKRKES